MKSLVPYLGWFVAALLAAIILWLGWAGLLFWIYPNDQNYSQLVKDAAAIRGQYGDMFGGLNSLLTSALFAVAFLTLILQYIDSREMRKQQQRELILSRRAAQRETLAAVIDARACILGLRYPMQKDFEADIAKEQLPNDENTKKLLAMRDTNREKIGCEFLAINQAAKHLEILSHQILSELDDLK